jgi:hypothetical protein
MRPLVRALLTFAAALAVWLVASPARAAAPLCDKRGAAMPAPAPTLQPTPPSLEMSVASCGDTEAPGDAVDRGQAPPELPTVSSPAPASCASDPPVIPPAPPSAGLDQPSERCRTCEITTRLDRPPRA